MIKKLKRRFIILAMVSLTALLSVIVAGMNIINYNTVISDADAKLAALSVNGGRLPFAIERIELDSDDWFDEWLDDMFDDDRRGYDKIDAGTDDQNSQLSRRGPFNSRDEAAESRFFSVLVAGDDSSILMVYTDRIFAVDDESAGEYAIQALKSGHERGFADEYRYVVSSEGSASRITFLDCSSALSAFRHFLYASIAMSLVGLLAVFAIIIYCAGRIVRPVAESYEKQKRFITDAGHEIKTPLAIIKANLDVMRMDLEDIEDTCSSDAQIATDAAAAEDSASESMQDHDLAISKEALRSSTGSLNESLDDIAGQVDRLASLTNDLVYLSRMEEGGSTLAMTEIPVSDIVSETVDSFRALAHEKGKIITTDIAPMLSMQGSSKEIEKLVSILTENALKYSPQGDIIHIDLSREGKNIQLEVRNKSAATLSDEDLAHVFERFYRADKSRNSEAGGHGIGLSMASAITQAHGGRIRARSGDGTEFIVTASMPASR